MTQVRSRPVARLVAALVLATGLAQASLARAQLEEGEPTPVPGSAGMSERLPPLPRYSSAGAELAIRKELALSRVLLEGVNGHRRALHDLERLRVRTGGTDAVLAAEHLANVRQLLDRLVASVERLRLAAEGLPRQVPLRFHLDDLARRAVQARAEVRELTWASLEQTWGVAHVLGLLDRSLRPLRRNLEQIQEELGPAP